MSEDKFIGVGGGPLPPAPHDWQKRFKDYESQLTDLREKVRTQEALVEALIKKAKIDELKHTDKCAGQDCSVSAQQYLNCDCGAVSPSNPIAERAVENWIPISEKLPDTIPALNKSLPVLFTDGLYVEKGWYEKGNFWQWDVHNIPEKVLDLTHWQPLPEPPAILSQLQEREQ